MICLNLAVSTMNNRIHFHWWLERGILKIKGYNCLLQKYSRRPFIRCEFGRFPLCPVLPCSTFSLMFRQLQTVFSVWQPFWLRFSISLVFVPIKASLRLCLWHIFRNSLCKRCWWSPALFSLSLFPHFFAILSFLSFEVYMFDFIFYTFGLLQWVITPREKVPNHWHRMTRYRSDSENTCHSSSIDISLSFILCKSSCLGSETVSFLINFKIKISAWLIIYINRV